MYSTIITTASLVPNILGNQPLSHLQIVWSWYMDFSNILGKFSTINPSITGLHLTYNPYPTIQSLQHILIPSCSHPWLSHMLWKHVSSTMWTILESASRNLWHISLTCLPRQPADQGCFSQEACILHHMDHSVQNFWSQQAGTHGIYASAVCPGNQQIREFQNGLFRLFSLFYLYFLTTVVTLTCFTSSCYPGLSREPF